MQATCAGTFPDTVTVMRPTSTKDAVGSVSKTWAQAGDPLPCRLGVRSQRHPGGDEPVIAGRLAAVTPYKLTVGPGVDILDKDRLHVTPQGITLEATRAGDQTSWNAENVIWCEEVL